MSSGFPYERVVVTGGAGFLGSYVVEKLRERGVQNVFVPRSKDYDLVRAENIRRLYDDANPDLVIHLAAVVGGIGANRANPGKYFYDNLMMGAQLMEEARLRGVRKFVAIGSVCFTRDALVQTGYRYLTIDKVQIGDDSRSKMGQNAIRLVMQRQYTGPAVLLKPYTAEPLVATPEHPFLVHTPQGNRWVAAKDVKEGDYLLIPRPNFHQGSRQYIDMPLINEHWRTRNLPNVIKNVPSRVEIDSDVAWLLGLYIAEGTVSRDRTQTYFSFGEEPEVIEKARRILANMFNLQGTLRMMPMQEGHQLSVYY